MLAWKPEGRESALCALAGDRVSAERRQTAVTVLNAWNRMILYLLFHQRRDST
jgi:hypothetical protein